jgi:hypothetical protein
VFGGLAQLVERLLCKQDVSGSSPLTSIQQPLKNTRRTHSLCGRPKHGVSHEMNRIPASFHSQVSNRVERMLDLNQIASARANESGDVQRRTLTTA